MKYIRSKVVYSKNIKGVFFLLEPNKRFMRELNDVGGFVWNKLEKPMSITKLTELVCKKYNVTQIIAEKDIKNFIRDYLKSGYIVEVK